MLATPPFGASSNIALLRANIKPPVELVVGDLVCSMGVKVFRTDEQGGLIATSDGKKITWNSVPSETWKAGEPTGSSSNNTGVSSSTNNKQESTPAVEEFKKEIQQDIKALTYVLNTKTKKFHKPSCGSLPTTNRKDTILSRDEIITQGYDPCKKCNP